MKTPARQFDNLALQAAWNLRLFGLFLVGPIFGVTLVTIIFDMSMGLRIAAAGMIVFILFLYGLLLRAEIKCLRASQEH
ncbi:hypothetical protein [Acidihalobacter ferrooxydans]|uniref:Uncharacterized protein n=1 Tax=Acidihalobacter ferrooxydans TaxID=1765967 RepID=A0A1P8UF67_9GAMM|nr:hypothetical protein [Acidihalobacter ferrooxydans]APZ42490.1 hypothetical protein BW247_04795 [Acidihalobacter ferrooxydans]